MASQCHCRSSARMARFSSSLAIAIHRPVDFASCTGHPLINRPFALIIGSSSLVLWSLALSSGQIHPLTRIIRSNPPVDQDCALPRAPSLAIIIRCPLIFTHHLVIITREVVSIARQLGWCASCGPRPGRPLGTRPRPAWRRGQCGFPSLRKSLQSRLL